jgi:hypothetical protein
VSVHETPAEKGRRLKLEARCRDMAKTLDDDGKVRAEVRR